MRSGNGKWQAHRAIAIQIRRIGDGSSGKGALGPVDYWKGEGATAVAGDGENRRDGGIKEKKGSKKTNADSTIKHMFYCKGVGTKTAFSVACPQRTMLQKRKENNE